LMMKMQQLLPAQYNNHNQRPKKSPPKKNITGY